jgi:hypothetical protein
MLPAVPWAPGIALALAAASGDGVLAALACASTLANADGAEEALAGASVPPVAEPFEPISAEGSATACLMALTRASVDSIDIARVIGRAGCGLSRER